MTMRRRLIPAHAGKTLAHQVQVLKAQAHPRSRGENPYAASNDQDPKGSSPLTRGKRPPPRRSHERPGLIPAHAGKTPRRGSRPRRAGAHPRSRGENKTPQPPGPRWWGSSPLTRGKLLQAEGHTLIAGLIPAHAGKTTCKGPGSRGGAAHPRSRGENEGRAGVCGAAGGSSPLTRGKRREPRSGRREPGLIPAHAGKTQSKRRLYS